MRNSTHRVVYRSIGQQIREAMHQFPTLENTNNRDFSIVFTDAPEFKFHFTINERFPETSPKILLNGFDFPTSLTSFWQPTITISQIVNHLHLIALARKNPNHSSNLSQNISFRGNLNSSMPPRFNKNHPDFNSMTEPNENQDSNDAEKMKYHKDRHNEDETKSEVEDDDEIDLDNIDVDSDKDFDDPPTELLNSSGNLSDNKYSSIRSGHKNGKSSKSKASNEKSNRSNKVDVLEEEEEEVEVEINIREINNEPKSKKSSSKNRKYKLKPNAHAAAIQNRDIFLDIEELDAVVTDNENLKDDASQKENENEFEDEDEFGDGEEEEEEIYEDDSSLDKKIRKLGYLYLKKNIDTIGYIQMFKELKKPGPKEADEDLF